MVSEAARVDGAAGSSSGAGVIVTGNSPGVGNEAGDGSLASRYRRRQLKTWFALTSYRRATTETDAPGSHVAATISRFNASGQRLCRLFASLVSMSAFVDTSPPALTHQSTGQTRSCAEPAQGGAHRRETHCPTPRVDIRRHHAVAKLDARLPVALGFSGHKVVCIRHGLSVSAEHRVIKRRMDQWIAVSLESFSVLSGLPVSCDQKATSNTVMRRWRGIGEREIPR